MSGIDHECTSEIVCPWCGNEWSDSGEAYDSDDEECDVCWNKFRYQRDVLVSYSTEKITDEVKS